MEEREQELCAALKETYQALALVTLFTRHRHPDPESVALLEATLDRARNAVAASEAARK